MQPITLRSRFGVALTVAVWLICLVSLVTLGTDQGLGDALRYAPALLLVGYAAWMTFWAPSVTVDPSGVGVHNIVRTHRVTWPAIQRIDTKYALTLFTPNGKYTAWSAPAPSRFSMINAHNPDLHSLPDSSYGPGMSLGLGDLPKSDSGVAAYYVRTEWEALRDAGHLDLGVVEGTGVVTTWHRRQLIVVAVLVVLADTLGYL
ncbi:MAG: PH domain-containing protein [Marmoricola sp.]